jgi:hydroxymethylglutaryl-CoA reductase (NADPH)
MTMNTVASVPTVGERLDALIDTIDSLPSTHLYGAVVAVSVVFSFALLNWGGPSSHAATTDAPRKRRLSFEMRRSASSSSNNKDEPQPKWHILRVLNYAAVGSFAASVVIFCRGASFYLNDPATLLQFLVGWSLFLCYFFGFFGISFVDPDGMMMYDSGHASSTQDNNDSTNCKSSSKALHPPAAATPVCSDGKAACQAPVSVNVTVNPLSSSAIQEMSDDQVAQLVVSNKVKDHMLEKILDPHRAVAVRRLAFDTKLASLDRGGALDDLPSGPSLDYSRVFGANCEIVVGYVPLPVGMVGPLTLNNETVYVPMATTEGCLVASTNRGAKAICQGGGAHSCIVRDGITRAPCVRMTTAMEAAKLKNWCEEPHNFAKLKAAFESTTSFGKLEQCNPTVAGKNVYLRLRCFSGDAMGMNMVSKGSLAVIDLLKSLFPTLTLVALSGNMCTDKKAAATNWIEGRGKSVVVEAIIPKDVVRQTLKTTVKSICSTNIHKNLIGSAMAGAMGGFNAHAANIVTAVFLATGQDPAQNVESSNCITLMEETEEGDLWISCTMPSIEVGTVGGGTSLPAQSACLRAIGCKGGGVKPGQNAQQLAHVVAAATMAGELSLLAALAANTLVAAHMQHNRKPATSK